MNEAELRRRFPSASPAFIRRVLTGSERAALDYYDPGLRPLQPKPVERLSLDAGPAGEKESWHDAARRFEIVFIIYSRRPCDWDGYDIKALQDFLITAGIIPDDGWKTLSGRVCTEKVTTEAEERTEIQIRPCR